MKRILILSLLFPFSSMAMEEKDTDTLSYAGIVTHIMSESKVNGQTVMFPCKKDVIVYTYDEENKEKCNYVTRLSKTYYNELDPSIRTSPDISSFNFNISNVSFIKLPDAMYASIDFTINSLGHGYYRLAIGTAAPIPLSQASNPIIVSGAAFSKDDRSYLPGVTYKAIEALNIACKASGKVDQLSALGTEGPVVAVGEHIEPSNITDLLRKPETHPLSLVIAFLKLQKQNNEYIPVPSKYSRQS